jgi:hypothetical protein
VDLRGRALAVDVAGQGNLAGIRAPSPRITEIEGALSKTAALGHAGTVSTGTGGDDVQPVVLKMVSEDPAIPG